MKRVFENLSRPLLFLAIVLLAAKLTASLIEIWLPPIPKLECPSSVEWPTEHYAFSRAFGLSGSNSTHRKKTTPKIKPVTNLHGYTLTMTAVGEPSMAIIVHNRKSRLLQKGESIDGFRLESVHPDRVKLVKNGQAYWLSMKKKRGSTIQTRSDTTRTDQAAEQIRKEGDTVYIPRELVKAFKDPKKIFRYIAIDPLYRGNKLQGFVIVNVKKGSVFDKMGLRKRDVILAVDGKPLRDEKAVFSYFNRIDTIDNLSLTIKRQKETKEIQYEIY